MRITRNIRVRANQRVGLTLVTVAVLTVLLLLRPFGGPTAVAQVGPSGAPSDVVPINFLNDNLVFEFVGQVINFATPPPLGSSQQFGYLTAVRGIDNVFVGSPHNEATAVLTFFNEAATTESFSDGPLRIIDRDGTTTIYLNTAPARPHISKGEGIPGPHDSSDGRRTGCNAGDRYPCASSFDSEVHFQEARAAFCFGRSSSSLDRPDGSNVHENRR